MLLSQPLLVNDLALRIRLVQSIHEAAIVRIVLDGLSVVQIMEIAKQGFGLQLNVAQMVHEVMAVALDKEMDSSVPTYLEPSTSRRKIHQLVMI